MRKKGISNLKKKRVTCFVMSLVLVVGFGMGANVFAVEDTGTVDTTETTDGTEVTIEPSDTDEDKGLDIPATSSKTKGATVAEDEGGVTLSNVTVGTAQNGETLELTSNSTIEVTATIGGNTSYSNRTLTIVIPQGMQLVSGTGIASVSGSSYTKQKLTPTEELIWGVNPDWGNVNAAVTDSGVSVGKTGGTVVYHLNDGVTDGTISLILKPEAGFYDYSNNKALNDIVITAAGEKQGETVSDQQKVGLKMTGTVPGPTATITTAATSVQDLKSLVTVSALEPFNFAGANTVGNVTFTLTYPTGAVLSDPSNNYTIGTPTDNNNGTSSVEISIATGKTSSVYTTSEKLTSFYILYPSDTFNVDYESTLTVSNLSYDTLSADTSGTGYTTAHSFAGPVSDTTTIIEEQPWHPTYVSNQKDFDAYNTSSTYYPVISKAIMYHNAFRSNTPIRYQFDAGSENQKNMDNISAVQIGIPGINNLSAIHIEFDDGTSTDWSVGDDNMPGAIGYIGSTYWTYTAPKDADGKPTKNIVSAYLEFSKSDYTSGTCYCTATGRPKSETYTEEFSEHTFSALQYDADSDSFVEVESFITNGFRWKEPVEFSLVGVGYNKSSSTFGDMVNETFVLSEYRLTNSTGSAYDADVTVDYTFDTDTETVTKVEFPYSVKATAAEGADTVESLSWTYEGDDTVYTWTKESGKECPFTATLSNGGSMEAPAGKSFSSFSATLSEWSDSTTQVICKVYGSPKTTNPTTEFSHNVLTVSSPAQENPFSTLNYGFRMYDNTTFKAAMGNVTRSVTAGSTTTFTSRISAEAGNFPTHLTFAIALPPDLIPLVDMSTLSGGFYRNYYNKTSTWTATCTKTRTLTDDECTNAGLPSGSTIWFYDVDDETLTVSNPNTQKTDCTMLEVNVPVQASPLANTSAYRYENMFFAGTNKANTVVSGLNNAAFQTHVWTNPIKGGSTFGTDPIGEANAFVSNKFGQISIEKDPAWIVQESICNDDDGEYLTYRDGEESTVVDFTKGDTGDMKFTVSNTVADADVNSTDGYVFIPIPKAGDATSSTSLRQTSDFDFTLNGDATLTTVSGDLSSYEIRYLTSSTEATASNAATLFDAGTTTYNKDATMVAVKLNDFNAGEQIEVDVPISAPTSVSDEIVYDKIQARSIFPFSGDSYGTYNSGVKTGWLRASYQHPDWDVTFESNGGSAVDTQTIEDGEKAANETPTRAGYTFNGWCTDEELTTYYDFDTAVTEDMTLYASWTEKAPVLIKYNAETGGTVSLARENLKPATGVAKGSTATAKPGYEFLGWYDDATLISTDETFVPSKVDDLNVANTYTAKFEAKAVGYKVEYYKQDMDDDTKYTIVSADTIDNTGTTDTAPTVNTKSYEGFTYSKTTYENSETVASETPLNIAGDESLVVKVYYTRNTCEVTFKNAPKGGTLTDSSDATLDISTYKQTKKAEQKADDDVQAVPSEGYVILGWKYEMSVNGTKREGTVSDYTKLTLLGDTVFTPIFVKPPYVVINSAGNGYVAVSEKGSIVVPTVGTEVSGTVEWDPHDSIDSDIALSFKAKDHYRVKSVTLKMPQSDYDTSDISIPLADGTDIDALATGMVESGGSAELNLADDKESGSIIIKGMVDNCVFTVEYEAINFTVSFDTDGGSQDPADQTVQEGSKVEVPANPTKDGYNFAGWLYKDGDTYKDYDFDTPITEDLELVASWDEKDVTILYTTSDANMGTVSRTQETLKIFSDKPQGSTATAKEGYHFVSWTKGVGSITGITTLARATAGEIVSEDETFVPSKVDGKNVAATYTARFAINQHKLKINYNYKDGGKAAEPSEEILNYDESYNVTSPDIDGYEKDIALVKGKMPDSDVEVTVIYTKKTNLTYKVEYYQQSLEDDDVYELVDTENETGTFDDKVTAPEKDYKGFTENTSYDDSKPTGNIKSDGSLVLKRYYNRKTYEVTYQYEGDVPSGAPNVPEIKMYKYGATIPVADGPTMSGATFSGWSTGDITVADDGTFVLGEGKITFTGKWTLTPKAGSSDKNKDRDGSGSAGSVNSVKTEDESNAYIFGGLMIISLLMSLFGVGILRYLKKRKE